MEQLQQQQLKMPPLGDAPSVRRASEMSTFDLAQALRGQAVALESDMAHMRQMQLETPNGSRRPEFTKSLSQDIQKTSVNLGTLQSINESVKPVLERLSTMQKNPAVTSGDVALFEKAAHANLEVAYEVLVARRRGTPALGLSATEKNVLDGVGESLRSLGRK